MTTTENAQPRLKTRYREEIKTALNDEFKYANVMQIPGVVKVVVNMVSATPLATPSSSTAPSPTWR